MNWVLILSLAAFGVLMGMLSVFGLTEGKEWWLWAIVLLITGLVLGLKSPGKFFKHGFFTGLISGLLSSLLTYALYDTYVANNAEFASKLAEMPEGFNMRIMMLASGPFTGAISGVILGLLAMLMAKLLSNPAAVPTTSAPADMSNNPPQE